MGARTDAARAEVVARRELLLHETTQLEASARAAADIPAKVKRNPVKTAGLAAGSAFLLAGGPGRVFRRVKRRVRPQSEWPKSLLPEEVDKKLRRMGDDGAKVRGTLEREFADYLEKNKEKRESRDLGAVTALLAGQVLKPVTAQLGKRLAKQLAEPDSASFAEAVERIRGRREAGKGPALGGETTTGSAGKPPSGPLAPPPSGPQAGQGTKR